MAGSRLALVAEDRSLTDAIQAHLAKHLGHPVLSCGFESVHDVLARDTDGLVFVAAASPSECRAVHWLVQDICLQKLPPVLALIHSDRVPEESLSGLDSYVARRIALAR